MKSVVAKLYETSPKVVEISAHAKIPLASATKMALGIHPDLKVGSNVLVLARQRIIDDINA